MYGANRLTVGDMYLWACLLCLPLVAYGSAVPPRQPKLIWEDNFDNLDEGRWHHLVSAWSGGNEEFQYYRNVRKNSWVDNGSLKIKPTPATEEKTDDEIRYGSIYDPTCNMEPCVSQSGPDATAPVFSARLHTQGTFDVTYGRIEIRAKLSRGDWIWPAIWMMPAQDWYGQWPRSGEIDIMESRGNRNLRDGSGNSQGVDSMGSTMHWGPDFNNNGFMRTHWEHHINEGGDYSDDFHSYQVEWTPDHIKFLVNEFEVGAIYPPNGGFWELGQFQGNNIWGGNRMAPFDKPFYIILNVAVGGHFFDGLTNSPARTPWDWASGRPRLQFYENQNTWLSTWDRPAMEVDYVRVWEL